MVILKTTLSVKMEHLEEVVELARDAGHAIRAEAGCLAYEVYLQADKPGRLMLWQQWSSEQEANEYADSEGAQEFLETLYSYTVRFVDHQQYSVDDAPEIIASAEGAPQFYLGDEVVVH